MKKETKKEMKETKKKGNDEIQEFYYLEGILQNIFISVAPVDLAHAKNHKQPVGCNLKLNN